MRLDFVMMISFIKILSHNYEAQIKGCRLYRSAYLNTVCYVASASGRYELWRVGGSSHKEHKATQRKCAACVVWLLVASDVYSFILLMRKRGYYQT